jgi:hypothetical protein
MREGRRIGHQRRADSLRRAPTTRVVGCRGAAPDPAREAPETPAPFPLVRCSRTVLAVKGTLQKIFSKPEKIFLRRAQTARP